MGSLICLRKLSRSNLPSCGFNGLKISYHVIIGSTVGLDYHVKST